MLLFFIVLKGKGIVTNLIIFSKEHWRKTTSCWWK